MGGAIARGLIASGSWQAADLICTAKSDSGIARIQATLPGVQATGDNRLAAREADIVILAVKPWFIGEVIEEIRPVLNFNRQLIVSVAAGISLQEMELILAAPEPPALFRAIPNTAVEVLDGVTFICRQNATQGCALQRRHRLFFRLSWMWRLRGCLPVRRYFYGSRYRSSCSG